MRTGNGIPFLHILFTSVTIGYLKNLLTHKKGHRHTIDNIKKKRRKENKRLINRDVVLMVSLNVIPVVVPGVRTVPMQILSDMPVHAGERSRTTFRKR